jgi:hypothetical protein
MESECYSGIGDRINLLQAGKHPMSFGIAVRNAVSIGLGGSRQFADGIRGKHCARKWRLYSFGVIKWLT